MSFPTAAWSRSLKITSMIGTIVLFGAALLAFRAVPANLHHGTDRRVLLLLPLLVIGICLLLVVSGYEIEGTVLRVRRLLWATTVPLDDLEGAWQDPQAMKGSLRVWGNGGLFSFSGVFRNAALGRYRAFVTDPARAVVLRRRRGSVVVSPADSQAFLRHVAFSFPQVRTQSPATGG